MAHITFDVMWREAIMELLDQLEAETPEDQALAPQGFSEWAGVYIKYVCIFRKLEFAYDQMVHPQKRFDIKRALEATMGRMLELRHWLVKLNRGLDYPHVDDILVDLKMTPDTLEVPVPKYFKLDHQRELETREIFLEQLIKNFSPRRLPAPAAPSSGPPLDVAEAIAVIQRNERGRQAREAMHVKAIHKRQRQLAERRNRCGVALTPEVAATTIQSAVRGMLCRRRIRREAEEELVFIGMLPARRDAGVGPQALDRKTRIARKLQQAENRRELEADIEGLKRRVEDTEGQDMRETVQDKINAWFVESRDPDTGAYPDFPTIEEGGSKVILNPPPPRPDSAPAEEKGKGKPGKGAKKPGADANRAGGKSGGKGAGEMGGNGAAEVGAEATEAMPCAFVGDIEQAIHEYVAKWQDRDESVNFAQRYDADLVKDDLRPIVFEEIRRRVDVEMRILLENLKDMVEAEVAAKSGKKVKKKKKMKKKKTKINGKAAKRGGKKKKDPTAERALEQLYVELVSQGILQQCPKVAMSDFLGSPHYVGATLEHAGIQPDPSMAQIRQALTEFAVLPLGSQYVHEKLSTHIKAILLYGHPKTGKSMMTQAIASSTGANFFNISPANTDGKYTKKSVAMMLHMVFKVAKAMAPSVIFIDEVEKVFISDKKKLKEFGSIEPYNRIKKDLIKEMKQLQPGERVLVIGTSSEPQLCTKKDEKALIAAFQKHICMPLPDYASRMLLWPGLTVRHGGVSTNFDWATLAQISPGYTAGQLDMVVRGMLSDRRRARLEELDSSSGTTVAPLKMEEFLSWLSQVPQVMSDDDKAIRRFAEHTPGQAALAAGAQEAAVPSRGTAKAGKKKGGKKA